MIYTTNSSSMIVSDPVSAAADEMSTHNSTARDSSNTPASCECSDKNNGSKVDAMPAAVAFVMLTFDE